jgi:hypothetical protein
LQTEENGCGLDGQGGIASPGAAAAADGTVIVGYAAENSPSVLALHKKHRLLRFVIVKSDDCKCAKGKPGTAARNGKSSRGLISLHVTTSMRVAGREEPWDWDRPGTASSGKTTANAAKPPHVS